MELQNEIVLDTGPIDASGIADMPMPLPIPTPKKQIRIHKPKPPVPTDISYRQFFQQGKPVVHFQKYKIPDLKKVAKYNRLMVGGNKYDLIARIECHFYLNLYAEKIQTALRGYFCRRMHILRGPAYGAGLPQCVNESDFYTMEPFAELPKQQFFSYMGEDGFAYGFDINSFMDLVRRRGLTIQNPYNRAGIPANVVLNAVHLYFYMMICLPNYVTNQEDLDYYNSGWLRVLHRRCINQIRYDHERILERRRRRVLPPTIGGGEAVDHLDRQIDSLATRLEALRIDNDAPGAPRPTRIRPRRMRLEGSFFRDDSFDSIDSITRRHDDDDLPPLVDPDEPEQPLERPRSPTTVTETPTIQYSPIRRSRQFADTNAQETVQFMEHIEEVQRKLEHIRAMPIANRIQELFMEMDQLGNYTDARWFTSLNKRRCFILYGHMVENWNHRSRLPSQTRVRICPLGSPFHGILTTGTQLDDFTDIQLIFGCVTAMENMIYTAYDVEDRKLGAFHVLTALTAVSEGAREALPWLFESIYGDGP